MGFSRTFQLDKRVTSLQRVLSLPVALLLSQLPGAVAWMQSLLAFGAAPGSLWITGSLDPAQAGLLQGLLLPSETIPEGELFSGARSSLRLALV